MSPPVDKIRGDDKLPASASVVIIGGGIIGCAAAYYLAKKGHSVALIEKGHVGGEQSSRNWGWCRQQMRDTREIPLIKESLMMWGGLNEEIGAETGFRRTGLMYVTKDPAALTRWESWLEHARQYQLHTRMLSATEAQAMMPGCAEKWLGGLYTPSDGRAEPAKAAPAIAEAARKLGVTIHQNCAARGIETERGAVAGVVTETGTIRTNAVLCAAGAWTRLFCRRHGLELKQLSVLASVLRTEPAPEVLSNPVGAPGFGMRRRLDGGYTVGYRGAATFDLTPDALRQLRAFWPAYRQNGADIRVRLGAQFLRALGARSTWALDQPSPFEAERVLDPLPDQRVLDKAIANLRAAYPGLRDVKVAETWAGMIESTPDAIPVISAVDSLPGFFIATGFSGHGFGIGPAAGRLAADLVAGDPPLVDPTEFRYSRMIDGTRLLPQEGL
ncbi:MAG TPA: FAD-binding oxidoreductase [Stellaceae bacterium]|nr:FAD-binding oxidoreductase [Stellaceae bacterium]